MNKYLIKINQEDPTDIHIDMDDPAYDGMETNIYDPDGLYHIQADTPEAAEDAARYLDSLGNANYGANYPDSIDTRDDEGDDEE